MMNWSVFRAAKLHETTWETPAVPARTDAVHGCQWSSSHGSGRAPEPKPTARARVGVWRAAAAHRCGLGIQSGCPAAACTALHWEELKLSSGNIVLGAGYAETRIHMQQPVQRYAGQ